MSDQQWQSAPAPYPTNAPYPAGQPGQQAMPPAAQQWQSAPAPYPTNAPYPNAPQPNAPYPNPPYPNAPYPNGQPGQQAMPPAAQQWPGQAQPPQTPYPYPGPADWPPSNGAPHPQPAPPSRPNRKRSLILALAGGGVALILVLVALFIPQGGGGSPTSSAAGGGNSGGQLKTLWAVPNQEGKKITGMSGAWATTDAVVDVRVDGAVAYRLSDGEQLWGWQAPDGTSVCDMAAVVSNGIGVIAYGNTSVGTHSGCDHLEGIDVTTGKTAWSINLDPQANASGSATHLMVSAPHVAVSGDTLAAVSEDNTLSSFDLRSGKLLWRTADELGNLSDSCTPQGLQVVGDAIYEASSCIDLSSSNAGAGALRLQSYAATGSAAPQPATLSTSGISGSSYFELWAEGNWLFLTTGGATGGGKVLGYPVGEGNTTPVSLDLTGYSDSAFGNSDSGQLNARGFAIVGDTLFIEDKATGIDNGISAINLKSGQKIWDQKLGGNASLTLVDADQKGVHAVSEVGGQPGSQLVTLDGTTGKPTYGASTQDSRFIINSMNTIFLAGTYLVDVSAESIGTMPAVVCLSGATS